MIIPSYAGSLGIGEKYVPLADQGPQNNHPNPDFKVSQTWFVSNNSNMLDSNSLVIGLNCQNMFDEQKSY